MTLYFKLLKTNDKENFEDSQKDIDTWYRGATLIILMPTACQKLWKETTKVINLHIAYGSFHTIIVDWLQSLKLGNLK